MMAGEIAVVYAGDTIICCDKTYHVETTLRELATTKVFSLLGSRSPPPAKILFEYSDAPPAPSPNTAWAQWTSADHDQVRVFQWTAGWWSYSQEEVTSFKSVKVPWQVQLDKIVIKEPRLKVETVSTKNDFQKELEVALARKFAGAK